MDASFGYAFPAIRGIQARREYYVSMCPLRLIHRIFSFDEEELPPQLRAQRILNKARIPEISHYILQNRDSYVFSAITASIDAQVVFEPLGSGKDGSKLGLLRIPMDARFIINDGQHRRAAIEQALRENPELADETIAVVFFLDLGLERCQQMFADLNRYAIRPSTSLGVLYDTRDDRAQLAKRVVFESPMFRDLVELERTTLSPRSRKLFTLSALYAATRDLLAGREDQPNNDIVALAVMFWEQVGHQFPEWRMVREGKMAAGEVRRDYVHTHAIVLQAIGKAGNALLRLYEQAWPERLTALRTINWSRDNASVFEGRTTIGGRVSKSAQNVILTTNLIKQALQLSLSPEEHRLEEAFSRGEHERA